MSLPSLSSGAVRSCMPFRSGMPFRSAFRSVPAGVLVQCLYFVAPVARSVLVLGSGVSCSPPALKTEAQPFGCWEQGFRVEYASSILTLQPSSNSLFRLTQNPAAPPSTPSAQARFGDANMKPSNLDVLQDPCSSTLCPHPNTSCRTIPVACCCCQSLESGMHLTLSVRYR